MTFEISFKRKFSISDDSKGSVKSHTYLISHFMEADKDYFILSKSMLTDFGMQWSFVVINSTLSFFIFICVFLFKPGQSPFFSLYVSRHCGVRVNYSLKKGYRYH